MSPGVHPYDLVPFRSTSVPAASVRLIEVLARLFAVTAAPTAGARVLELGCGGAANLIPLAFAHPRARFVGCDLSRSALASAQRLIEGLGLTNIHYDRAWAMDKEGYPGLTVHGPLSSTLLIDFARDQSPGRTLVSYRAQARAPLFDTAPFELRGRPSADGKACDLWAVTPEGTVAVSAHADFA